MSEQSELIPCNYNIYREMIYILFPCSLKACVCVCVCVERKRGEREHIHAYMYIIFQNFSLPNITCKVGSYIATIIVLLDYW